ncbi:MAG: STAS domain-containing protein [Pseudomonadales bacterium]|nr:STAS domain-containing protein [Pseudomonadales bacterium]
MVAVHKQRNLLVTAESLGDHANVLLAGELNSDSAPLFEKEMRSLIENEQHARVVISLENLSLITSAGLRVLLVLAKELRKRDGNISLYAPKPNVREIFEITGFDTILDLSDSYEDAVFAFGSPAMTANLETELGSGTKRTLH